MHPRPSKKPLSAAQLARVRRKEITRVEQREKMLASAARLFGSQGFDRTTLDQVAAGVGLTKPRLYFHFKDKRQILNACLQRVLAQWKAEIPKIEAAQLRPGGKAVRLVVKRYADVAFGDFGMCLMRGDAKYLAAEQRDPLLHQSAEVTASFKRLIAKVGKPRSSSDPEFLWLMTTILVQGIALLECSLAEKQKTLSKAMASVLAGSNIKGE